VEAAEIYAQQTGYPIQYQWTLLEGVNDTKEEIEGIVRLLKGKYALMNMIPYNSVDDLPYKRPSWERAAEIARTLHRRGILTKLRNSAGQDVEGGCGQLRARQLQEVSSSKPNQSDKTLKPDQPIEAKLHFVKAKPATLL
jgi:23S rRNA (adenine2503-C2)-methyltransferase